MKKIDVIKEQCIGCGACVAIDAEHFEFDDEGRSQVISNENLESTNLTNAIESCPTSAIELVEVEGNDDTCTCECEECNCECNDDCEDDCACDCGCGCCGCKTEAE